MYGKARDASEVYLKRLHFLNIFAFLFPQALKKNSLDFLSSETRKVHARYDETTILAL